MHNLNSLRLDTFSAQNGNIDIQKGKYLRRWKYKVHFHGDLPRTAIKRFTKEIGAEAEWTSDGHPTIYFDDIMIHKMARSVAEGTQFNEVMTPDEALQADAEWQKRAQYRVLFEPRKRPEPSELANRIEDEEAELITWCRWRTVLPDGSLQENTEVLAVLTNKDDTMALLRLAYAGAHVEERRTTAG